MMSISINNISYIHPDRDPLFQNISFSISNGEKVSLIGKNGAGKSTLLQIIAGKLEPNSGRISYSDKPYYVPQHFGQYDKQTVAEALLIDKKLIALQAILDGDATPQNFDILNDDWNIKERAVSALANWNAAHIKLSQKMETLSGGEKTKVFLAGIVIHQPSVILLDEPSNHLDIGSRQQLYDLVTTSKAAIVIVSHDRTLLNLINTTYELNKNGIDQYGGNYDFYKQQKDEQIDALHAQLEEKEKQLRLSRKIEREAIERKQKQDARGEKQKKKGGVPRIVMGKLKDQAEKSSSKLKEIQAAKTSGISNDMTNIRQQLPQNSNLKMDFENANLHKGKTLIKAENINFEYDHQSPLWENALNIKIESGERILIKGRNGVGKTSLINLLLGKLKPLEGTVTMGDFEYLYFDQECSVINNNMSIVEQAEHFNSRKLLDHELKTLLNRYNFPFDVWEKKCSSLSGGEKIRLAFCCLAISNNTPDIFVLDEPTNNLDIQSIEIITSAIREYEGTILLISHDRYFINEIGINREIEL